MPAQRLEQTFRRLRIGVVVASASLSGLCGFLAGAIHGEIFVAGNVFGVLAGIGAGLLWSLVLQRATLKSIERTGRVSPMLILYGVGMGLAVGMAATAALHAALTVLTLQWNHIMLAVVGQAFGIPAGLGLGLVCGFIWWLTCRAAWRKSAREVETAAQ